MRKWIPILLAPIFQALIGYALWLLWHQWFGDNLTHAWIDPNQLNEFEEENILQLKQRLATFGAGFWLLGAVASWVWLYWSRVARLYSPKNVASLKIVWWGCFALGGLLALVLGYLDVFGTLVDLRADLRMVFPAAALILYVVAFWLVGSWLFTRPVARPAVPYASWVRMPWG